MKSSLKSLIILVVLVLLVAISGFALSNNITDNSNGLNSDSNNSNINENTFNNDSKGIVWDDDLDSAKSLAKNSNKSVLIFFEANWCTYCNQMNSETFTDGNVNSKLSKDYVCVKIEGDKNPELASEYNVSAYPTIIILDSNSKKTNELVGFYSAEDLLSNLK